MRFRVIPFLFLVLNTAACHDHELASPYTSLLSRREAEVVAHHLRYWRLNVYSGSRGDGPVDPQGTPSEAHWSIRCWNGGKAFQTWRHDRTWNDSTRVVSIETSSKINQDDCRYSTLRGITIGLSAEETLTFRAYSQFVATRPVGAFTDHFQGTFSWRMDDRRRGKCTVDYRYVWNWDTKIEERVGNVCGHLFNERNDFSSRLAKKQSS